jgi:hypothetical protein
MQELTSVALSDPSVQLALKNEGAATFIAHILPRDYGMIGMFADIGSGHMFPEHITAASVGLSRFKFLYRWFLPFVDTHMRDIMGSEGQEYRVVFSRVDRPDGLPVSPQHVFDLSAKMTPVYLADINAGAQKVSCTIEPPRRSSWGDVKMPIF